MREVIKRNGIKVPYERNIIAVAIGKAFLSVFPNSSASSATDYGHEMALNVESRLDEGCNVESIQDCVERVLMENHEYGVAKAYILYRNEKAKLRIPHMRQNPGAYVIEYPKVIEMAEWQQDTLFWRPKEIRVYKDIQDLRVNMSEAQLRSFIGYLKLFTEYELRIGRDWWIGRFLDIFPRPEFNLFGTVIANTEQYTHARFYNMANEVLGLNTKEFQTEWKKDPDLVKRIDFLDAAMEHSDPLVALAAMVYAEGMILFSPFAYFKSYQENGFNLVPNFVSGIEFSLREEAFHAECTATFFKELLSQSNLDITQMAKLRDEILRIHHEALEHERIITLKAYEHGDLPNINVEDHLLFVEDRASECLAMLGFGTAIRRSPINTWFYASLHSYIKPDQFVSVSREYTNDSCAADYEIEWKEENE